MATLETIPPPRMRFTREQFDAMIANGVIHEDDRVELIEGEIYVLMAPGTKHIARVNRLQAKLILALQHQAIVSTQNPIGLSEYSEPQPDIAVLKPVDDFYENRLAEPSDVLFIVEVSDSTLRYDRDMKVPLYAACDIAEVWLLDVTARQVTVFRSPAGNHYEQQTVYGPGDSIPLTGFSGLSISTEDLGL